MKYLIIEDELAAFKLISKCLTTLRPEAEIIGPLQTVADAVDFFNTNEPVDIVFMDIHLADGFSFRIFEQVEIPYPVIFTTAYDEHAIQAFDVNAVDYLLKPITEEKLERAIERAEVLSTQKATKLLEAVSPYKSCLLIPQRDKLVPVKTDDIAIIYLIDQLVKVRTFDDNTYYLGKNLEDIYAQLNPVQFYRANRQTIINRRSVKDITLWFGSKLSVNLNVPTEERIIISKSKTPEFKSWLSGSM